MVSSARALVGLIVSARSAWLSACANARAKPYAVARLRCVSKFSGSRASTDSSNGDRLGGPAAGGVDAAQVIEQRKVIGPGRAEPLEQRDRLSIIAGRRERGRLFQDRREASAIRCNLVRPRVAPHRLAARAHRQREPGVVFASDSPVRRAEQLQRVAVAGMIVQQPLEHVHGALILTAGEVHASEAHPSTDVGGVNRRGPAEGGFR